MFDDEFEDQPIPEDFEDQKIQISDQPFLSPDLASYPVDIRQEAIARYQLVLFLRNMLTKGWTQRNIDPLTDEY
ncbi:MAG: hypothetical protein KC467_16035, partial [Marinomonas atlantica]|nr:hypothetical protein [Marinomonas atlantica]